MASLINLENNMFVIKYRKIFYAFSAIILAISLYGILAFGLNLGIDFKGGTLIEAELTTAPDMAALNASLASDDLGVYSLRSTGQTGVILRARELSQAELKTVSAVFTDIGGKIIQADTVGPILGEELSRKALWSIFYVIIAIVLFISFTFRGVSRPIASWKYGAVAIVALIHDVIVPTGVFAFLGHFKGTEIDALFITALLVVLGFSVHDTIVVFDRTRENLHKNHSGKKDFETIVGESVSQTFARSINTSLTTLLALAVLYAIGPAATRDFSLALLIGITAGTYSSIFIGSPLLVTLQKFQDRKKS
ncbi:MAG: protein translocase subunit SecF [Patescibacteria group bacterium]